LRHLLHLHLWGNDLSRKISTIAISVWNLRRKCQIRATLVCDNDKVERQVTWIAKLYPLQRLAILHNPAHVITITMTIIIVIVKALILIVIIVLVITS